MMQKQKNKRLLDFFTALDAFNYAISIEKKAGILLPEFIERNGKGANKNPHKTGHKHTAYVRQQRKLLTRRAR